MLFSSVLLFPQAKITICGVNKRRTANLADAVGAASVVSSDSILSPSSTLDVAPCFFVMGLLGLVMFFA